jgi:GT2 family glycosyltransferase
VPAVRGIVCRAAQYYGRWCNRGLNKSKIVMVSVVIINFNTFQLTCNCISSVFQHTSGVPFEIILVDNASTECDPRRFKEQFPSIKLIQSPINEGFAKGNNLGIAEAEGEVVLLLNSDTYFTENSIKKSADYVLANPQTGVLGCRMTYPNGLIQYTARKFRSIWWELLDSVRFLLYLVPYRYRAKIMLGKYFRCDIDMECDWVNGAFFMFRKELLLAFPGKKLDDTFFMYGEDQLWCWQIKYLGYKVIFFAGTSIVHISNASTQLSKRLQLRRLMLQRELSIMQMRKQRTLYYYLFAILYSTKENIRYLILFLFERKIR